MPNQHKLTTAAAAILAATLVPIAVGADADADARSFDVVTLRLARTTGFADRQIEHLIGAVTELSGGQMVIEVATEWDIGDVVTDVEQQIVGAVAAGEADLGWVGSRAFGALGVNSFAALTAPFLVDSYELQRAILASDIPERMLAGLDVLGVTGLAVTAGGLRKPIGVDSPLLGPDDYDGITMHAFPSGGHEPTLTALGAVSTSGTFAERDAGLLDGTIDAYENTLVFFEGHLPLASHITLNVNLWPATGVVFVNPATLSALDDTRAGWLRAAVADTVAHSVEIADVDATVVAGPLCAMGADLATATDADLDALREAVEPVYTQLRTDAATAEYISAIDALKASTAVEPLSVPSECAAVDEPAGTSDPRLPDGIYRTPPITPEVAAEALRARGLPDSASDAGRLGADQVVVFTVTIDSGSFALTQSIDGGPETPVTAGGFEVVDDSTYTVSPTGGSPLTVEFTFNGTTLTQRLALADADVQQLFAATATPYIIANTITIIESAPFTKIDRLTAVPDSGP